MKVGLGLPFLWLVLAAPPSLVFAARIETVAPRGGRLGHVGVMIIAFEAQITFRVALALGERCAPRDLAGILAILIGVALLADAEGARPAG